MEEAYMDDAESTIEQDIRSVFFARSDYTETFKNITELAKDFELPIEQIMQIVQVKEKFNSDYLESLETQQLESIYYVLVRNLGNQNKTELISNIENIIFKRTL